MVARFTYRRKNSFNTKSNRYRRVRTPGGKLTIHYRAKTAKGVRCGDCGCALAGIPVLRPTRYALLSKREKTVARAYGGSKCARCVRERILRSFLLQEQKIVKRVVAAQKARK